MIQTAAAGSAAGARSKRTLRCALAVVVGAGLTLAACDGSSSSSEARATSFEARPRATSAATASAWAKVDRALSALGPDVGFLAATVSPGGTCRPVHEVASSTARPTASQFKLFVLGALAKQVAAGGVSWDRALTVDDTMKSLGNGQGSLQFAAPGTSVSVEEAATKMISISDNTAADMLIALVGRDDVEAQVRQWSAHASANEPFLTTREMFLLHYAAGLADRYLATPKGQRAAFLASSVDPRPLSDIASGFSQEPRYVDTVEWFASPADVCRAFAGLQVLSKQLPLAPSLSKVLSHEVGGIGLDRSVWPTVWFKGGSEPGVLTLGWLATNSHGKTFVVEAMVSNRDATLAPDSITDLVALAKGAFGLLG
jgi:beta-lactamase class A